MLAGGRKVQVRLMGCECPVEDSGEECTDPECQCDEDYCHVEPCPVVVGQAGAFGQFVTCGKPHAIADHKDWR